MKTKEIKQLEYFLLLHNIIFNSYGGNRLMISNSEWLVYFFAHLNILINIEIFKKKNQQDIQKVMALHIQQLLRWINTLKVWFCYNIVDICFKTYLRLNRTPRFIHFLILFWFLFYLCMVYPYQSVLFPKILV